MLNIFKYIDYAMKARQGYEAPNELLADTSFGIIEGFFITSFIILGLASTVSLYLGFGVGYLFFKIFGIILCVILIADILVFRYLKNLVNRVSKHITDTVRDTFADQRPNIQNTSVIDVEAQDHK